jgi:tRNA nucleotidyltransferase (CCA-adding enzyme)
MSAVFLLVMVFNYEEILKEITPTSSQEKKLSDAIILVSNLLEQEAQKKSISLQVLPGGSTAKKTYLKGDFDIDIFARFKTSDIGLSNTLEELLSSVAPLLSVSILRIHGSRDYFQFIYDGFHFEIVPVKYISSPSQAENITDMSSLHVSWFNKEASSFILNDIRLAKQFFKSARVYGAESYIQGFSGHVVDILVLYYGGFDKLLTAISTIWSDSLTAKKTIIIDYFKKENSKKDVETNYMTDALTSLNSSKINSSLIIIDPIDKHRNASAALSEEKLFSLIKYTKAFLKNPSRLFFLKPVYDQEALLNSLKEFEQAVVFEFLPLKGSKDIVGTKIFKIVEFLKRRIQEEGFKISRSDWFFEKKGIFYIVLPKESLKDDFIHKGPPNSAIHGVRSFKEKYPQAYLDNDFWFVSKKRSYTTINDVVIDLLVDEYVFSRCKKASYVIVT